MAEIALVTVQAIALKTVQCLSSPTVDNNNCLLQSSRVRGHQWQIHVVREGDLVVIKKVRLNTRR